jgi:glycosyltransferase involved in cell wall biosynthesis
VYGRAHDATEVEGERPLRVAIVAPPWFEVPPDGYGGIERVCFELAEGLVDRGHEVTLVAAGRDRTRARFIAALPEPPPGLGTAEAPIQEIAYAARVADVLATLELDVVHDHSAAGPLVALRGDVPTVVTAHGPTHGWLGEYYRALGLPLVAASNAQRGTAPDLPWLATVANAVDVDSFAFSAEKDGYALFLGRLSPEKGVHLAVEAVRAAGMPIVIAGKCREDAELRYFRERVAPLVDEDVTWIGEVYGERKATLLARAACVVVAVQWEEPFGLVCVEALASGTPVVGLGRGAIGELVEHGRTGWLCDDPGDLPALIARAGELDPHECRAEAIRRFDTDAMVDGYVSVYRRLARVPVR